MHAAFCRNGGTMGAKRAETDVVNITLRVPESLRQHLEESARARHVSLNTELNDRLEHVRDRQGLLMETMTLAYGTELASILMLVGAVMAVTGQLEAGRDWTAHPGAYGEAEREANRVLEALRPEGGTLPKPVDRMAWEHAVGMVHQFAGPTLP